ncbi:Na+/H+ antiporter subunit E [Williamsia soli]|uniref:Na+/H+ antiporter subunit E n=1 Tax=Williamsia soli TaxID=364929 RepID=UPI001A9D4AC6|nr:Na+/H+ antiporter subunit E [Williamsia soli]
MSDEPTTQSRPQPPPPRGPIRAALVNAWRFSVIFLAWYIARTIFWFRAKIQIKRWFGGNRREVAVRLWNVTWLTFVWVLLWGTYDLANVFTGIGVALLVLIALPLPRVPVEGRIHPLTLLELAARLIAAFFISSAQVAWAAVRPAKPPLSAVLRARLAIKSDMVLTLAVDYLNLVPGTMVVEIDHSRRLLYVHLFDASSPEKVKAFYKQIETIERLFIRGFERDHEWRASPYHGIDDDLSAGDYPRGGI